MRILFLISFLTACVLWVYFMWKSSRGGAEVEVMKKEVKKKKKKKEAEPPLSYIYETPELREKNRKAIQAWLLKHTGSTELKNPTRIYQHQHRRRRPRPQPRWEEPKNVNPYYFDDEEFFLRKLDGEF